MVLYLSILLAIKGRDSGFEIPLTGDIIFVLNPGAEFAAFFLPLPPSIQYTEPYRLHFTKTPKKHLIFDLKISYRR
ncbi:hypothetical protein chiPu_0000901 [Chiloscyllium punctatum]|uniref:Uncharacterized protein n=1 Tax=Chiloscyllium punctatum TaxID=137246 RepID=A0A401RWJ9_CHIPU|nr:hypothetical protein [Chiloscyllium punctatum]